MDCAHAGFICGFWAAHHPGDRHEGLQERDGEYFVFDGTNGLRFIPGHAKADAAAGDRVRELAQDPGRLVIHDLTGKNPWIADDTNPAMEQPHAVADNIVEAVNNDQSFADLSKASVTYSSSKPSVVSNHHETNEPHMKISPWAKLMSSMIP